MSQRWLAIGNSVSDLAGPRFKPISGWVDRMSAIEAIDSGSIPGRVKPKTIKIDSHNFPAWLTTIQGTV